MSVDKETSASTASSSAVSTGRATMLRMKPAARRPRLSPPGPTPWPVSSSANPPAVRGRFVRDQMYVDRSRLGCGGDADAWGEQLRPAPPAARTEHQLRGVDAARKGQQGVRDVGPDHLVVGAAEVFDQHALACQMSRISTC